MNILVIGAKGFIGSHLVSFFLKQDFNVTSCDVQENANDESYFQVAKFNSDYNPVLSAKQFDACIYAGGNGSVPYSIEFPESDFHLNTYTVNSLLSSILAHQNNCRFVHISSAAVYGKPVSLPVDENAVVNPLSPYGWHKYLSECICKKFTSLYGIPTCSIRVFSVYGEGLMKQLFWDIYQKIKVSGSVTLFGTGNESRDFIYISDLTEAINFILQKGKFVGETINVASGTETTIKTAAEYLCKVYDENINLTFNNQQKPGDPPNWCSDITLLSNTGFAPRVSLKQGLNNYIRWLKERE